MEGKKQHSSSSSSLSAELFGSKDSSSSSSSSGFFNSIFPPPSKVHGKDYINSQMEKKYDFAIATKQDYVDKEDMSRNPKTDLSPFYEQQQISQPCHLSSSIYYGGQEIYTNPLDTKNNPTYNQEEDDGRASRGNWWQGSLYY